MGKLLVARGEKKDSIIYRNPEHVKQALRDFVRIYATQVAAAKVLDVNTSTISKILHDRMPVSAGFLEKLSHKFGTKVTMEPPVVAEAVKAVDEFVVSVTEDPSPKRVMAVVDAMERLTEADVELLEKLINFRTKGEALNPRTAITAIQDITLLRDMLT
jgi:transcriptional regulator with XRE-family HTH domain